MASIYYLFEDAIHTEDYLTYRYADFENTSKKEYFDAVKIQSAFRGYLVRKKLDKQNASATKIQKVVRGWLVRYHLPDILHEYYDRLCIDRYNKSAIKIQALYKGYVVRKEIYIPDILAQRAEMVAANARILNSLRESLQEQEMGVEKKMFDGVGMEKIMNMIFNRHHLLGTHQRKGVLSKNGSGELSELEKVLKMVKWKDYMDEIRKFYNKCNRYEEPYNYMFEDEKLRKLEDLYVRQRDTSRDVRVEIDYTKLEAVDKKPFNLNINIEQKPYERQMTMTGKYIRPITKITRTEEKWKNISDKDFDLNVVKKVEKPPDVPPYYIDFWYSKCKIHNLPE